jgi:Arc/MetJ family transcription regulator
MVSCMKTTVEISDSLLSEAKRLAAQEGTTIRALIEQALRRLVQDRTTRSAFHLRAASFRGAGLQAGIREGSWEQIRGLIYEGRGE